MEDGKPRLHTVGFPKSPVYLLDAHNPEAVAWYVALCEKWEVDGFKEDLYRYERYPLPDDKLDPVNIVGGIVIEEIDGELMARIYPIAKNAETTFFARDGETASNITINNPDWDRPVVTDRKTGAIIPTEKVRHAHQFRLAEGHDYLVR